MQKCILKSIVETLIFCRRQELYFRGLLFYFCFALGRPGSPRPPPVYAVVRDEFLNCELPTISTCACCILLRYPNTFPYVNYLYCLGRTYFVYKCLHNFNDHSAFNSRSEKCVKMFSNEVRSKSFRQTSQVRTASFT